MRTAIYGAGSLGTILGAYIAKNGGNIELINRNKAHIEALQKNGAKVTGTVNFTQKVTAYTPDAMSGKYDIIFLMTKQQQNREVVTYIKDFLADDGVIVTLQNGIPELLISEIVGEQRVLGCTVAWGATMQEPGVCELTSSPDSLSFSIGSLSAKTSHHLDNVKGLLQMMGTVEIDSNFIGSRWSKLLINSAFSGMSAVLGCTFGEAAKNRASCRVVQALIKECIDVCAAGNIKIEPVQGKDIVKLLDYKNRIKKAISLFIIPIALLYIGLGLLCGSIFNDKQVGGICGALLTNGSAWLSGVWFDLALVGGMFKKIAYALPFVHAVDMERALLAGDFGGIFPHLWWVLGYAIVLLVLAVLLFLRQMKRQ